VYLLYILYIFIYLLECQLFWTSSITISTCACSHRGTQTGKHLQDAWISTDGLLDQRGRSPGEAVVMFEGAWSNRQKKTTGISWLWYAVMIWQGYVKEVLNIFIINNHVDMTYKCVWVRIGWFFGLPHCIVSVNDRYCQVHHPKMNLFWGGKIWYHTFWWGLTTVVIQYK
jgi:hypothetical protein